MPRGRNVRQSPSLITSTSVVSKGTLNSPWWEPYFASFRFGKAAGVSSLDAHTALPYHLGMKEALVFEWDEAKADANYRKHHVTFQFAARAFDDNHGLDLADDRMDYGEERWLRIALVEGRVLSVAYTRRKETVRIVSARASTRRERRMYHG